MRTICHPHINVRTIGHPHINMRTIGHPHINVRTIGHPRINVRTIGHPRINVRTIGHPRINVRIIGPVIKTLVPDDYIHDCKIKWLLGETHPFIHEAIISLTDETALRSAIRFVEFLLLGNYCKVQRKL